MKYIVEVTTSNPSHEHMALRRVQKKTNFVVEASNEAEALVRARGKFRSLGQYVHNVEIVEGAASKIITKASELLAKQSTKNLPKTAEVDMLTAKRAMHIDDAARAAISSGTAAGAAAGGKNLYDKTKKIKEETIEEKISLGAPVSDQAKAKEKLAKSMEDKPDTAVERIDKSIENTKDKDPEYSKRVSAFKDEYLKKKKAADSGETTLVAKEEVEYIEEKLTAADPASKWISDFVASDNPKFKGKSKKERIRMALGAKYAAMRNEEVEQIDEIKKTTLMKYVQKAVGEIGQLGYDVGKSHGLRDAGILDDEIDADEEDRNQEKLEKRTKGVARASAKLAKEEVEQMEEGKGYSPGWMLKKDPKLSKKLKDKINLAKKRQASYGNPKAGISVKEEVVAEAEGRVAVTPKEKALAAHHGDPKRITYGDVVKARIKSGKKKVEEQVAQDRPVPNPNAVPKKPKEPKEPGTTDYTVNPDPTVPALHPLEAQRAKVEAEVKKREAELAKKAAMKKEEVQIDEIVSIVGKIVKAAVKKGDDVVKQVPVAKVGTEKTMAKAAEVKKADVTFQATKGAQVPDVKKMSADEYKAYYNRKRAADKASKTDLPMNEPTPPTTPPPAAPGGKVVDLEKKRVAAVSTKAMQNPYAKLANEQAAVAVKKELNKTGEKVNKMLNSMRAKVKGKVNKVDTKPEMQVDIKDK